MANTLGWILDIPALVSLLERLPKMVPATAALVLASTASLWLQIDAPEWRRSASLLGALVCAAGLFMLTCYLADRAPLSFQLSRPGAQSANSLSSPVTAGLFGLLGMALVLLAHGRQVKTAQLAAMAVLLLSLLNLAGYFFQGTLLYAVLPGKGVSLLTTMAAILLAAVALMLRPTQGIMVVVAAASPWPR